MPFISPLDPSVPITDNQGYLSSNAQIWFERITRLDLLVGTGSPEGIIEAEQGRVYMNDTGTPVLYIKQSPDIGGDRSQGWVAV